MPLAHSTLPNIRISWDWHHTLQVAVIYSTRERDNISDVAHSGDIHYATLEAQSKACMACRTVTAQIQIELIIFLVQSQLFHTLLQDLQVVLTLAAADDLTDAGHEAVHGRDGLAIGIQLHVECLDLLRVIRDEDRALEDLLGEVPLVLGLQIAAPEDLVIELVVVRLKQLDSLGIRHMAEIGGHDVVQAVDEALVDKLVEECHFLRRVLQHVGDDELDHVLGELHVVGEIGKRDLRLDHPELRRVAGRVGVFGAECRAEGIDVAERLRKRLAVELAGDGQVRLLAEEVLAVVDLAVLRARQIVKIERCDLEHFACALAVGAGDERGVDIDEIAFLEELVDGVGDEAADAEDGLEGVRARTQMRHGAQILHRMALGLDGIIRRGGTLDEDLAGLQLERLLRVRRQDERTGDDDGRADVQLGDLGEIRKLGAVDDLHLREKRAVGQVDEAEVFAGAQIAYPAADLDLLAGVGVSLFEKGTDRNELFHGDRSSL